MAASDFLSISEWCTLHGKDPGNVRKLIQQGRIPAEKIGKQWVIPADAQPPPTSGSSPGITETGERKRKILRSRRRNASAFCRSIFAAI